MAFRTKCNFSIIILKAFHTFRYVVEGRTAAERLLWVLVILASFSISILLVQQSIEEGRQNPIATSIESVPITVKIILAMGQREFPSGRNFPSKGNFP
jgi:hypothetical protein